ncbi:MAG: ABC transporter permease, partial [Bacteroidota bacterium]
MRLFLDELREGFSIAFGAIRANKMRSALTTLGIVIGIVSVTLMGTAIEGLNRAFNKSIAAIGADVLYVQKHPWGGGQNWWEIRNRRDIRIQQARVVKKSAELVKSVSPAVFSARNVVYGQRYIESVLLVGSDADLIETSTVTIAYGRFFTTLEAEGGRP